MSDHPSVEEQRRDELLLRLLHMPPQPRPKRERDQKVSQRKDGESSPRRSRSLKGCTPPDAEHRSDGSRAIAATDELLSLLEGLPPETIDHIDDILHLLRSEAENLFVIRGYDPTALRAEDRVIFLEPSLLFRELMAAIRARTNET